MCVLSLSLSPSLKKGTKQNSSPPLPPSPPHLGRSAGGVYTIASTSALGAAAAASSGVLSTALPYRETEAPKE